MALIDATAFKVQTAAMATALTAAWKDTVKTEVAKDIRNPAHPLRRIEKYFNFNSATGVVSSDDGYVDACYAGKTPSKGNGLDVVTGYALALSTATVENGAPTDIVLTFGVDITSYQSVSIGGTPTKAISSITVAGAVVTITADSAYVNGDTISVSGAFNGDQIDGIALVDEVVTNNVT